RRGCSSGRPRRAMSAAPPNPARATGPLGWEQPAQCSSRGVRPLREPTASIPRSAMSPASHRTFRLAVIPGDGIGPEVIAEAEKALDAVCEGAGVTFEKTRFSLGAGRFLETGDTLSDADLESIKGHDAILLGAVGGMPGDPRLANANIERGLLLKLRFELDHYVNLRPSR